MKIRNLTAKPIGFGSVVILPDQIGEVPKGYGRDHPTVKYYLSRKWIEEVGVRRSGTVGNTPAGLNANTANTADTGGTGGATDENDGDVSGGDENNGGTGGTNTSDPGSSGGAAPENKPLDRMNKDELQALAFAQGVVFAETDTRQVLIDKIKAAKNASV